jgi:hypothetical protein
LEKGTEQGEKEKAEECQAGGTAQLVAREE